MTRSAPSNRENATERPSCDHAGQQSLTLLVIWVRSSPPICLTQIPEIPGTKPIRRKATRLPSGENAGSLVASERFVKRLGGGCPAFSPGLFGAASGSEPAGRRGAQKPVLVRT